MELNPADDVCALGPARTTADDATCVLPFDGREESTPLEEHLKFITELSFTQRRWRSAIDKEFESLGLSGSLWIPLWWIGEADEPLIQRELADRIGIGGPSLVHQLDTLEKQGLIKRRAAVSDRRSKRVHLTPKGEIVLREVVALASALADEAFAGVSPSALRNARRVMREIRKALNAREVTTPSKAAS